MMQAPPGAVENQNQVYRTYDNQSFPSMIHTNQNDSDELGTTEEKKIPLATRPNAKELTITEEEEQHCETTE